MQHFLWKTLNCTLKTSLFQPAMYPKLERTKILRWLPLDIEHTNFDISFSILHRILYSCQALQLQSSARSRNRKKHCSETLREGRGKKTIAKLRRRRKEEPSWAMPWAATTSTMQRRETRRASSSSYSFQLRSQLKLLGYMRLTLREHYKSGAGSNLQGISVIPSRTSASAVPQCPPWTNLLRLLPFSNSLHGW